MWVRLFTALSSASAVLIHVGVGSALRRLLRFSANSSQFVALKLGFGLDVLEGGGFGVQYAERSVRGGRDARSILQLMNALSRSDKQKKLSGLV